MKLEIRVAEPQIGTKRAGAQQGARQNASAQGIEVTREGARLRVAFDGHSIEGDAIEVAAGTYSVLVNGKSFEVRVEPAAGGLRVHSGPREYSIAIADPRDWRRRRGGALEAEGRQEVMAPMPGKVVRVLVEQGAIVEAGQGLFVVEAMKMQNEIRSPKKGTIERVLVKEGQAVNSGDPLAVVV